jgi:nucleotide-binding universal stress UspA family protein
MQGIVVGVSPSTAGAAALDWALGQAVLRGVPVAAVRAWDIPSSGPYYSVGTALRTTSPDFEATELQIARDALSQARARVPGAEAVEATAVATRGRAPEVLVTAAREAELLAVGARGVGALTRVVHLGSVSSSVLHHATGPVAVVPDQPAAPAQPRIVVGVDDSPRSARALEWAVQQARLSSAVLVPVEVRGQERRKDEAALAELDAAERRRLSAAAEKAGAGDADVPVEPEVRSGHAAHELIAAAEGAALLVVGTRGRGGFATLLLGSTTHQVAGHASCPVVVVRSE